MNDDQNTNIEPRTSSAMRPSRPPAATCSPTTATSPRPLNRPTPSSPLSQGQHLSRQGVAVPVDAGEDPCPWPWSLFGSPYPQATTSRDPEPRCRASGHALAPRQGDQGAGNRNPSPDMTNP